MHRRGVKSQILGVRSQDRARRLAYVLTISRASFLGAEIDWISEVEEGRSSAAKDAWSE
jgi:hypothetical protein